MKMKLHGPRNLRDIVNLTTLTFHKTELFNDKKIILIVSQEMSARAKLQRLTYAEKLPSAPLTRNVEINSATHDT